MKSVALAALVCAGVAGCGGSGDSAGSGGQVPLQPPSFNVDAAFANALSASATFGFMPGSPPQAGNQLAVSFEPTTDGDFFGQATRRTVRRFWAQIAQPPSALGTTSTISYQLHPTRIVGEFRDANPTMTNYDSLGDLPTGAQVGDSGPYALAHTHWDPLHSALDSDARVDWSVEPDAGSTAWACLSFVPVTANTAQWQSEKDCLRIDSAGTVLGFRAVMRTSDGQVVTYQAAAAAGLPVTGQLLPQNWAPDQLARFPVLTSSDDWQWFAGAGFAVNVPAAPPLDFSQDFLAVGIFGQRPSACWAAELVSVTDWPDRLTLRYRETYAETGCVQSPVTTGLLVGLPRSRLKATQWVAVP